MKIEKFRLRDTLKKILDLTYIINLNDHSKKLSNSLRFKIVFI